MSLAMRVNSLPKELNLDQSFLTAYCVSIALSRRPAISPVSCAFRENIRMTGKFVILSDNRSNTLSQSGFTFDWLILALRPKYITPPIPIGRNTSERNVKIGSMIIPPISKIKNIRIWGRTAKIRLSHISQTASADLSTIFCFSPAWILRWYSIGSVCILVMMCRRKFLQSIIV